ncbi:MAG: hypothetical protein C4522_12880 [Desulfobacteraceae bacterium]|nr:MAG: hypothetical protein C4522_12880 [Desulfobacteraceae bacterium]
MIIAFLREVPIVSLSCISGSPISCKLSIEFSIRQKSNVRIYRKCGTCEKQIQIIGLGNISRLEDVYII